MDISRSQKTTATNQVMENSGEGIATIVLDEDTRITTTIFTSKDIVHDLLALSNEVMRKMGILWNQDSVTPGTPPARCITRHGGGSIEQQHRLS